jgi:hypothetical protein
MVSIQIRAMLRLSIPALLAGACLSAGEPAPAADASFKVNSPPLVMPSFRKQQLQVFFMAENPADKALELTPRATITDFRTNKVAAVPKARKIALPAKFSGETSFAIPARGLKTWSHWDPQLYFLDVELDARGQPPVKLSRVRFGYREMWTEEGYFLINGKRVMLVGGNHDARRSEQEMKYGKLAQFTADTVRSDYKAAVKTFDLSDQHGHYLFYAYAWYDVNDRRPLYEFGNHPSLVGHALGHEGYYSGPHGHPLQIGGVIPDDIKAKENIFRVPEDCKKWDPSRIYGFYVHGVGGEFRSLMWDLGWGVPAQSQEEWLSEWAKNKEKIEPFFSQEFALMRLGANQVKLDRNFGPSALVEHMARYLGDESYRMFDDTMVESYTPGVKRPQNEPESKPYYRMKDYIYSRVVPAWRTYGNGHMLLHVDGHPQGLVAKGDKPTSLCETFAKVFAQVYFYLGGPKADFVSKDHLFYGQEQVEKSAIVINDSADDIRVQVSCVLRKAAQETLKRDFRSVSVSQGGVAFVPIRFKAPSVTEKTVLKLSADCKYKDGKEIRSDEMELRVFPKTDWKWRGEPVLLVDSSGKTGEVLGKMGVGFMKLSAEESAAQADAEAIRKAALVVVGKNSYPDAVKVFSKSPVLDAVRNGLNLVVLEQMNRHVMGLKLENTSSRDVYVRAPDSPLLAGLDNRDFANWRSESQMLPSYPSFDPQSLWWWQGYSYQGQFNKWRQRRAWHWSNKAMVATFCAEKPQFGNFRVLLDAGFDLLYTPLVEFQVGKGRVLLNQLDLVDHYGIGPVATMLLQRILDDYSKATARTLSPVAILGDGAGAALKDLRMQAKRGWEGQVAFLLPDDLDKLDAKQTEELRNFVQNGGSLVTSVKTAEQAAKLPVKLTLEARKAFNPTFPDVPAFSGLGISDLFLREMHDFLAVTKVEGGKATFSPTGIAGTVECGKGRIVLLQVPPDKFKGAEAFWGRSKVLRTYSAILSNLGGRSEVELDPLAIGGWGIAEEWLPGYDERVPKKAPKLKESNVYEKPALDWDPDSHVCW